MTRILIVEDEESYREPLVYQLTREGYDVSAAATGEEGLELFTKGGIDLVLLDLMLPGLDGTALCRRIREQSRVPGTHPRGAAPQPDGRRIRRSRRRRYSARMR